MLFKYIFANHSTQLSANLCHRCLRRLFHSRRMRDYSARKELAPKKVPKRDFLLYLREPQMIETVMKHVNSGPAKYQFVFESSPGTGLLTEQLLKTSVQSVRVFEDNPKFTDNLRKLQNRFPNRLQIIDKQIIYFEAFLKKFLEVYVEESSEWLVDIPVREWSSPPHILFVAVLSPQNSRFIRQLMKNLLNKDLFFAFGRTQLLVFISENEYKYLTAKPASDYNLYRSTTVLFNTLFDIETLETVDYERFGVYPESEQRPGQSSDPKPKPKPKLKGKAKLVRLTPKLYLDQMDVRTLNDFRYFVVQTFMKRKNYVIPFLENWFPNCGPDLILKGIPVFRYFGDLSPEEVLELFNYFQNRSDYQKRYKEMDITNSLDFDGGDDKDLDDHEFKDKAEVTDTEL